MNSRKTNLRLIENITVQVPNTASITSTTTTTTTTKKSFLFSFKIQGG